MSIGRMIRNGWIIQKNGTIYKRTKRGNLLPLKIASSEIEENAVEAYINKQNDIAVSKKSFFDKVIEFFRNVRNFFLEVANT